MRRRGNGDPEGAADVFYFDLDPPKLPNTPHRLPLGIRSRKKRTETNKVLSQPASSAISSVISLIARLSCVIKVLLSAPPSMWSVRSRLANRYMASLFTARN